jgi:energy-coupling factor transporter transmembrane protein EcfT
VGGEEEKGGVGDMNNFYIAFAVYLNLIFVAAKLWGRIDWSWLWVMTPLIVMTMVGVIVTAGQSAQKKHLKSNILYNLQSLKDLIENSKSRSGERH